MQVRLSAYLKNKFILIQWQMELKNEQELLSQEELHKSNAFSQKVMIIRFEIMDNRLILNERETFKYKYLKESIYMGGRQNFINYVKNYFNNDTIERMISIIIADERTREIDRKELLQFLPQNVKHNKVENELLDTYYRYSVSESENRTFVEQINYLIYMLERKGGMEATKRALDLKNILKNVKHIEISKKKKNATNKARETNKEKSIIKIELAYKSLKKEGKKVTIYSIAKVANVSYSTAKKYVDIYKDELVKNV